MAQTAHNTTEFTMPSDVEVQITRVLEAPRELVWEVFTKPEHLQNWMLGPEGWEMPICELDLRPGGTWHYEWRHASGEQMEMSGVYQEVTPQERIVNTENWGGGWPETVNTLTLTEEDGKTTVRTVVRYPSVEARDAALQTGMRDGVNLSYERLEKLVRSLASAV
jgi:uncharacterized protein YndB with AHSA1/START domain